eukprot:277761-Chlamydomonas_euryale.AAC.2
MSAARLLVGGGAAAAACVCAGGAVRNPKARNRPEGRAGRRASQGVGDCQVSQAAPARLPHPISPDSPQLSPW